MIYNCSPHYIRFLSDPRYLPYKFRQKVRHIDGMLSDLYNLSCKPYYLYVCDEECLLVDVLDNQIIWTLNYSSSMAVLLYRLTELTRFWLYEKKINPISNQVDYNDYRQLKKKYIYERKTK